MKNVIIIYLVFLSNLSFAAVIEVDGSICGLRDAINAAETSTIVGGCSAGEPGEDVLNLTPNTTFSLTEIDPQSQFFGLKVNFFNDIVIEGNGSIIERADNAPEFGILAINNARVTINNLTIRNGYYRRNLGGGILAFGGRAIVTLNSVNVVENVGGGVLLSSVGSGANTTPHRIYNSRIANNTEAPFNDEDRELIGAGIGLAGTIALIKNTTIDGNHAGSLGGGIWLFQSELELINSTISGNISGGSGGGIAVGNDNNILKIFGSTISNNSSSEIGGGINFNANGDVTTSPNNYFRIYSSLISGNVATVSANEINGPVDQAVLLNGRNIVGTDGISGSDNVIFGFSDLVPSESIEQILLPLNDEIDFMKVHNLVENSPAIDYVANPCVDDYDQIGNPRPLDGDNDGGFSCDAGSIEYVSDLIFQNGFE